MSERDDSVIRTVAWTEVCPWLAIVRSFRLAIAARVLVLGAAGILLTATAWSMIGGMFGADSVGTEWLKPFTTCPWKLVTEVVPNKPAMPTASRGELVHNCCFGMATAQEFDATQEVIELPSGVTEMREVPCWRPRGPIFGSWALLTSPATEGLKETGLSARALASVLSCGLLATAIWAFFGGAICRIAVVQLAAGEQVGLGAALRYARRKWLSYFWAPLMPVIGVALATIPIFALGLVMRAVGLWLGIFLWPLALAAGLLMALLLAGLLFGWPLMWATISAEGTDSFDALSRAYAYTFQRPLHYLFYAVVAALIGWLGWLVVQNFAAGVVWMGYWAVGWGCSSDQLARMLGESKGISVGFIHFWAGCVKLLAVGYLFSYFWTAAGAIYLLLRRDVDATEMDEVFLDADASEERFGLPTIATDEAGAPAATDDVIVDPPDAVDPPNEDADTP
jgi:hypothetical protein